MSKSKLQNEITIDVVSPNGEVVEKDRKLRNVAIEELFPNEPVCLIDWLAFGAEAPSAEELEVPVLALGTEFQGYFGWGSAVKRCITIGLANDILADCGLLKHAERGIKTGRMLLNQGLYGGLVGDFRIKVVKAGTIVNGYPLADGHSLIRRSLAVKGDSEMSRIHLGSARQSYQMWQRIPWSDELQAELKPLIDEALVSLADPSAWVYQAGGQWDERKKLVDVEPEMAKHPYVAQAFGRAFADHAARMATTAPVPCTVKVAVPTTAPKTTVRGKAAYVRYPVDSNGSIKAAKARASLDEIERVAKMEVIQYTVASKTMMANGCFAIVDDDLMPDGVDIVLCQDDIKMGDTSVGLYEIDGVVSFNQWFAKGCAIGMNPKWSKKAMGLDYDGDLVFVYDLSEFPVLYKTIDGLIPGETPKLAKTKSGLEMRSTMIRNSMRNIVGFATNVASATFCIKDREWLASKLGFKNEKSMNAALNWFIKVGTDGFKTMVDLNEVERQLVVLQGNLVSLLHKGAPWCKWPNDWAFRRGVPGIWRKDMDENEKGSAIPPAFDGTIAQICKLTLPSMQAALTGKDLIEVKPLGAFKHWAPGVSDVLQDGIHTLQLEYNSQIRRVNWVSPESIGSFRVWWQGALSEWQEANGITEEMACNALWRETHSARSENSSGASVFMGYPELALEIVQNKPGFDRSRVNGTLLIGLNYVFEDPPLALDIPVEVRELKQKAKGRTLVRSVLIGQAPGKKDAKAPYPAEMLGMVDRRAEAPAPGMYMASIRKAGHGMAWHCDLTRR